MWLRFGDLARFPSYAYKVKVCMYHIWLFSWTLGLNQARGYNDAVMF